MLDLFSRRVVGWATSDRLKRDLAVEALRRALVARNPAPGLLHHSDRGSQYCSVDYQALLRKSGILIPMSGRGNCYDNSMVLRRENSPPDCFLILLTFFKTIKSEMIWPVAWQSRQQAENAIARYIDGFYNPVRQNSSLGFQTPTGLSPDPNMISGLVCKLGDHLRLYTQDGSVRQEFTDLALTAGCASRATLRCRRTHRC